MECDWLFHSPGSAIPLTTAPDGILLAAPHIVGLSMPLPLMHTIRKTLTPLAAHFHIVYHGLTLCRKA